MREPKKVAPTHPASPTIMDDSAMIVTMTVGDLRGLIRAEVEAAKKTELPRLLYNTAEAAKILNVPKSWLAAKARAGEIKVTRKGYYVRFTLADLEEFAAKNDG
jgi:excisionase family DNA binding protein